MTVCHPVKYFKSIESVRETTSVVYRYAKERNEGNYFKLNLSSMPEVVEFLCGIIERDYGSEYDSIPPHGRWQHINAGGHSRLEDLVSQWLQDGVDEIEISRRLVDLILISVLIDAGAGSMWSYQVNGETYSRSEGLAVASFHMFLDGALSDNAAQYPHRVNGQRLKDMTMQEFCQGFQISKVNPLSGMEGRMNLVQKLGEALISNPKIFGPDARPGAMVDYLHGLRDEKSNTIGLADVWNTLMDGLVAIWPKGRTTVEDQPIGDAWTLDTKIMASGAQGLWRDNLLDSIVTFHKLTQWLCYSILVPLEAYGHKFNITDKSLQTGLPEYRNGGLFYDFGVLELKSEHRKRGLELSKTLQSNDDIPTFTAEDGAIVEWRCLTIGLLDELLLMVNQKLGAKLSLPQLIEAGSWKAGREIAAIRRPTTKGPPIELCSDGTVF
ncbi:hypothetical protein HG536_0G01390 [Torulaspora globosa]|uniref:Uracil catabolism protein 4 n=1 Tax=Torulaspora globosa TaxID=48254 RepID=A0A7G3ZL94_9SACH|nr:uncharacterized protein HG536_0G01390 [Torulaspora globosa]QLL34280.1 hypothetical protein HG536_0G01390 [Torulaspora globosa]